MPADFSLRIKSVQKQLAVSETGVMDMPTCIKLEERLGIKVNAASVPTHVKAIQRTLGVGDDGMIGPITLSRIEALISTKLPAIPAGASLVVSVNGVNLIVNFEVTSKEVYDKKYQQPIWPGGESGVTIGIGYDCGFATATEIARVWGPYISPAHLALLQGVAGKKGTQARDAIASVKAVKIPYNVASQVFYQSTLPAYAASVKKAYPGVEKLPPDAQAALLSLVYNRGASTNAADDRRKEMAAIVPLVKTGDVKGIGAQIRSMKRLWPNVGGLITRREKEAVLAEQASFNILPEEMIVV